MRDHRGKDDHRERMSTYIPKRKFGSHSLLGLINISELGRVLGIHSSHMYFYLKRGYIPRPKKKLNDRFYYTKRQVTSIKKKFEVRDKYERFLERM